MAMRDKTKQVKAALRSIPDHWVRTWRDGTCWCGTRYASASNQAAVLEALQRAEIPAVARGTPGTAGEYTIEVL
jgi:hypothetical protein